MGPLVRAELPAGGWSECKLSSTNGLERLALTVQGLSHPTAPGKLETGELPAEGSGHMLSFIKAPSGIFSLG